MDKRVSLPKWKIVVLALIAAIVLVIIYGDVVMLGKLSQFGDEGGVKGTITIISVLVIIIVVVMGIYMLKIMQAEEQVSTVRSDKGESPRLQKARF